MVATEATRRICTVSGVPALYATTRSLPEMPVPETRVNAVAAAEAAVPTVVATSATAVVTPSPIAIFRLRREYSRSTVETSAV
ncbi:hypothetical protein D3C86_2061830 [compost metagenome]